MPGGTAKARLGPGLDCRFPPLPPHRVFDPISEFRFEDVISNLGKKGFKSLYSDIYLCRSSGSLGANGGHVPGLV